MVLFYYEKKACATWKERIFVETAKMVRHCTFEDIEKLPEGQHAELIDGQIYMMASPNTRHQEISGDLYFLIRQYISKKGGKCEVFAAPFGVFLKKDESTYLEPDISVICDRDKIDRRGCNGAPDWVIEIIAPGSFRMDFMIKLIQYREAGVLLYWIVDPKEEKVYIYDFRKDETYEYSFDDIVKVAIYDDFAIDFKEIGRG